MNDKQKKMLGLGGVGVAGLLVYRHLHPSTAATAASPTTMNSSATGTITPYTPQSPVTVPAGSSIYDPNNQALLTAPGTVDNTGSMAGTTGTQAVAAAAPSYSVNVNYPSTLKTVKQTVKPTKRAAVKKPAKPKAPVKKKKKVA